MRHLNLFILAAAPVFLLGACGRKPLAATTTVSETTIGDTTTVPAPAPAITPSTPPAIRCSASGVSVAGANTYIYTAGDCGGALPDSRYIGFLYSLAGDAGFTNESAVGQPFYGDPAYVTLIGTKAAVPFVHRSIYFAVPAGNVVSCFHQGANKAGNNRVDFTAPECTLPSGVRVMPDAGYFGLPAVHYVNGGNIGGWRIGLPMGFNQVPGVSFWANSGAGQNVNEVIYFKPSAGTVTTCSKTGVPAGASYNSVSFTAADCSGKALPGAKSIAIPVQYEAYNATGEHAVDQDGQFKFSFVLKAPASMNVTIGYFAGGGR